MASSTRVFTTLQTLLRRSPSPAPLLSLSNSTSNPTNVSSPTNSSAMNSSFRPILIDSNNFDFEEEESLAGQEVHKPNSSSPIPLLPMARRSSTGTTPAPSFLFSGTLTSKKLMSPTFRSLSSTPSPTLEEKKDESFLEDESVGFKHIDLNKLDSEVIDFIKEAHADKNAVIAEAKQNQSAGGYALDEWKEMQVKDLPDFLIQTAIAPGFGRIPTGYSLKEYQECVNKPPVGASNYYAGITELSQSHNALTPKFETANIEHYQGRVQVAPILCTDTGNIKYDLRENGHILDIRLVKKLFGDCYIATSTVEANPTRETILKNGSKKITPTGNGGAVQFYIARPLGVAIATCLDRILTQTPKDSALRKRIVTSGQVKFPLTKQPSITPPIIAVCSKGVATVPARSQTEVVALIKNSINGTMLFNPITNDIPEPTTNTPSSTLQKE